jgi:hypothetical protein
LYNFLFYIFCITCIICINSIICTIFYGVYPFLLLNTRQVTHPSHKVTSRLPGPRPRLLGPRPNMRPTLQHRFTKEIEQYTNKGVELALNYKKDVKAIHTKAVSSALSTREHNHVLGVPAPEVHPSDKTLLHALTMCQLCSGHCNALQSYKHKINSSVDVSCPGCHNSTNTVVHLFNCPSAPTPLQPIDMCVRLRKVAEYALSLHLFSDLPPLVPSLPRLLPSEPPLSRGRGL